MPMSHPRRPLFIACLGLSVLLVVQGCTRSVSHRAMGAGSPVLNASATCPAPPQACQTPPQSSRMWRWIATAVVVGAALAGLIVLTAYNRSNNDRPSFDPLKGGLFPRSSGQEIPLLCSLTNSCPSP